MCTLAFAFCWQVFNMFLDPQYPPPATFTPGVTLSIQPRMTLISKSGTVVQGRRVIAFASQSPFIELDLASFKGQTLFNSVGADLESHDLQGQRVATLVNFVSQPSAADGTVVFEGLTITGTSSPFVYIGFYCEGEEWDGMGGACREEGTQPHNATHPPPLHHPSPPSIFTPDYSLTKYSAQNVWLVGGGGGG